MNKNSKNKPNPKIWVLIDNRVGNANQALALASKLSSDFEVKNISYNQFAKLPNFLLTIIPIHITRSILHNLKNSELPDIIISSGRRIASLAVFLKKISKNEIKIVQIMRPNLNPKHFALIILPQHDTYQNKLPNVIRVIGALNNIQDKMDESKKLLYNHYPDLKAFVAVIIGGSNKKAVFNTQNGKLLVDSLKVLYRHHSLPLFITFSRRTPKRIKAMFKKEFLWPHIIYDPVENLPNPYPGIIGSAEYIIITADSISMCSEAASTGKPIYVFCPNNFHLPKHKFFIQQLADLEIVKRLESNTDFLIKYDYEPLREIDKVVEIVKTQLF